MRFNVCFAFSLGFLVTLATAAPVIKDDGPNSAALGRVERYPVCEPFKYARNRECRVGAFSAFPQGIPHAKVKPKGDPLSLPERNDPPEIFWGTAREKTIASYLDEVQITSLLIIKDGEIVAEHYQYARTPGMPMKSNSMAKTLVALLIGVAHQKGLIESLDDVAAKYWPEIESSAYGQTTIKNLLRMSSGVPFKELYTWTPDDDIAVWSRLLWNNDNKGKPARIAEFLNKKSSREVEQGKRFRYASVETDILGRVLERATKTSIEKLTEDWLWTPMGAEDEAYWTKSSTDGAGGFAGGFGASTRDYGRLGVLLANDGVRGESEVLPTSFLLDATEKDRQPEQFRPGRGAGFYGYGYQTWILPYRSRTFALQGIFGQTIFVQPESKIVMVQTAVYDKASGRQDPQPYIYRGMFFDGVLKSLGGFTD